MTSNEMQTRYQQRITPLLGVHDPQERLSILARPNSGQVPELPKTARDDAWRVPGCISRVWLRGRVVEGRLQLEFAAESTMVRGLALALCVLYHDYPVDDGCPPPVDLPLALGLVDWISPTRVAGLQALETVIRQIAWGNQVDNNPVA